MHFIAYSSCVSDRNAQTQKWDKCMVYRRTWRNMQHTVHLQLGGASPQHTAASELKQQGAVLPESALEIKPWSSSTGGWQKKRVIWDGLDKGLSIKIQMKSEKVRGKVVSQLVLWNLGGWFQTESAESNWAKLCFRNSHFGHFDLYTALSSCRMSNKNRTNIPGLTCGQQLSLSVPSTWRCISLSSCLGVSSLELNIFTGSRFGRILLPAYWQRLTDHITAMLTPTLVWVVEVVSKSENKPNFFLLIAVKTWQDLTFGCRIFMSLLWWRVAWNL